MRASLHCARRSREGSGEELSKLPPTAWVLIGCAAALGFALSWVWRWYRKYSARKALRAAVTAASSDHLVDMLVPDGMGGGFHVDFLLLTRRGVLVIDLRDVQRQYLRRRSDGGVDRHGRSAPLHLHQPAELAV